MDHEPFLVRFARAWGWRAYAIPVLAVLTVLVVIDVVKSPGEELASISGTSGGSASGEHGPIPSGEYSPALTDGALPPGAPITEKSTNEFVEFSKPMAKVGEGREKTFRYAVEVENTIDPAVFGGGDAFASTVNAVFSDSRGWTASPDFAFEAVTKADKPEFVVQLVSTSLAKEICGNALDMETSCYMRGLKEGEPGRVVVNEARWVRGAVPFQGDLGLYRQYLINHEVGHALGFASHEPCPKDGAIAPIMMQQTLSVSNDELYGFDPNEVYRKDGKTCSVNGWPYPFGAENKEAAPTNARS